MSWAGGAKMAPRDNVRGQGPVVSWESWPTEAGRELRFGDQNGVLSDTYQGLGAMSTSSSPYTEGP